MTSWHFIGSKQKLSNIQEEPLLKIGDMNTKSLGLMIDESLTGDALVDLITTKASSGFNILGRLRDIVDHNTLIMVYKYLIEPYFDYCSQIWVS